MNGGSGSAEHHASRHGRHRKVSGAETWTPAVPEGVHHPHARGAATIAGSIVDTDLFPNLRPARHEAPARSGMLEPSPEPVLAPKNYLDERVFAPYDSVAFQSPPSTSAAFLGAAVSAAAFNDTGFRGTGFNDTAFRDTEFDAPAFGDAEFDDRPFKDAGFRDADFGNADSSDDEFGDDKFGDDELRRDPFPDLPRGASPRYIEPLDEDALEDSLGLRKFNLGTVPASVTPPKSWRRAAWFSVSASAAALAALVTISSAVVGGPSSKRTVFDAAPDMPSALVPSTVDPDGGTAGSDSPTSGASGSTSASGSPITKLVDANHDGVYESVITTPGSSAPGRHSADATSGATGTGSATATDSAGPSSETSSSETTTEDPPPQVTTKPSNKTMAFAGSDGDRMHDTTTKFAEDPAGTADASPAMSESDKAAVKRRYADVESVSVKRMTVDPDNNETVNEFTLHYKDGSTSTEQRTLKFTRGKDPQLVSEQ
jgi:hypothetical protein